MNLTAKSSTSATQHRTMPLSYQLLLRLKKTSSGLLIRCSVQQRLKKRLKLLLKNQLLKISLSQLQKTVKLSLGIATEDLLKQKLMLIQIRLSLHIQLNISISLISMLVLLLQQVHSLSMHSMLHIPSQRKEHL